MKIEPATMLSAADAASDLLKALANRHRLMLLCQLTEGERSVGDLAAFLDLRDSTVSQHLALLRRDGIVVPRRDGQTIYYAIGSEPIRVVIETLYRVFCGPARVCEPEAEPPAARPTPPARKRKR